MKLLTQGKSHGNALARRLTPTINSPPPHNTPHAKADTSLRAGRALKQLDAYIQSQNFLGYDPYDALNSPILRAITWPHKYARIAATQAIKRMPINLRPLLLIPKDYNPKGLGLFLWGYAKLYALNPSDQTFGTIQRLLTELERLRSRGYSGNCWGYNFPWQSRAFYLPRYTPTIVNTSFIGHALLDAYRYTGNEEALKLALPIVDFLLKDLHRTADGDAICFSYTPVDETAIHNANLLGASLLIRLHEAAGLEDEVKELALQSLRYSMNYQHDNGAWWYAETDYQKWIDSFHTGFNLQCLSYFLELGHGAEYQSAFDRGVEFYTQNLFETDGTAKYYHDRRLPEDIHSYAQAIVVLSQLGDRHRDLLNRVLARMLERFQSPAGYFYFQRRNHQPNRIPYIRWAQSWAFHALTEHALATTLVAACGARQ